ncbi:MAG: hypothetical protein ABFC34_10775 [Methanobacterium sp.]
MVELVIDPAIENKKRALEVYEKISNILLPEYEIYNSGKWFATDYALDQGHLDFFIEKNTHKGLLFLLNRKIGRSIFDGDNSIGILTDCPDQLEEVAKRLENNGFRVVIYEKARYTWIH